MVQLSTLQMPVFTQQRPNIWATSQLISSEQFKWGSWLLNLSAFDYITPPFPSMVSILSAFPNSGLSKIPIPVLWPSAWMHPAHSTSVFLPFAIQLPMHKRSPLLLSLKYLQTACLSSLLAYRWLRSSRVLSGPAGGRVGTCLRLGTYLFRVQVSPARPPTQQYLCTLHPQSCTAASAGCLLSRLMSLQWAAAKSRNTWSLWSHKP